MTISPRPTSARTAGFDGRADLPGFEELRATAYGLLGDFLGVVKAVTAVVYG